MGSGVSCVLETQPTSVTMKCALCVCGGESVIIGGTEARASIDDSSTACPQLLSPAESERECVCSVQCAERCGCVPFRAHFLLGAENGNGGALPSEGTESLPTGYGLIESGTSPRLVVRDSEPKTGLRVNGFDTWLDMLKTKRIKINNEDTKL